MCLICKLLLVWHAQLCNIGCKVENHADWRHAFKLRSRRFRGHVSTTPDTVCIILTLETPRLKPGTILPQAFASSSESTSLATEQLDAGFCDNFQLFQVIGEPLLQLLNGEAAILSWIS